MTVPRREGGLAWLAPGTVWLARWTAVAFLACAVLLSISWRTGRTLFLVLAGIGGWAFVLFAALYGPSRSPNIVEGAPISAGGVLLPCAACGTLNEGDARACRVCSGAM